MIKLINTKTNEVLADTTNTPQEHLHILIEDYLDDNNIPYHYYNCLSDLISMLGTDDMLPFDTLGELLTHFPDMVNCKEENTIFYNIDSCMFVPMGWGYEYPIEVWNKILRTATKNIILKEEN